MVQILVVLFNMETMLEEIVSHRHALSNGTVTAADAAALPSIASLRKWLQDAFVQAKNAPVFLVGSRGDVVTERTDHETISTFISEQFRRSRFWPALHTTPDSLNFYPVDNTLSGDVERGPDPNVRVLREQIDLVARQAAHAACKVPVHWLALLDWLHEKASLGALGEKRGMNHISMGAVAEQAKALGMPSRPNVTIEV